MKSYRKIFGAILLTIAVLSFAGILFRTHGAVKDLSVSYHVMTEADLSGDYSGALIYDDHLYAMIGKGVEIDGTVTDRGRMMNAFLDDALRAIEARILSAGVIYAMMICAVAAYPIYGRYGGKRGIHVCAVCLSTAMCCLVYFAAVLILFRTYGVPFYFPTIPTLLRLAAGLLCVVGGSCVLALLISVVRFKAAVSVIAVPIVFVLFMAGLFFEIQLYNEPTVDSFAYLAEIDERVLDEDYAGELYYDDEKNVVVLEGKEYPPRQERNPEHLFGIGRWGGFLYEVLDPYSGNSLYLAEQESSAGISIHVYGLYALKAALWICAAFILKGKNGGAHEITLASAYETEILTSTRTDE